MRIYATYYELRNVSSKNNNKPTKLKLVWKDIRDDCGNPIKEEYFSNPTKLSKKCRFGERFAIDFKRLDGNHIIHPTKIRKINKNLKCNIIRSYDSDYIFIKGKYKGKKISELDKLEITNYLLYLAKKTYNEMTVINVLNILKKLNNNF